MRASKNSKIEFICIHRKKGDLFEAFKALKVPTSHCHPKNRFDISYFFKLRRLLSQEKIEVVHAHQVGARRHARWDVDQRVMIL